ncbi:hypothetical protein DRN98_10155 [Methanosarcinales archaeon]|nr:MAG: hypothetical protein DRN98_10155 [Methanosarcinales archaeon]
MNKKTLTIGIVCMFLLTSLTTVSAVKTIDEISKQSFVVKTDTNDDEIDQYMTSCEGAIPIGAMNTPAGIVNISIAQSFTPQKEILTRVQCYMGKNITAFSPCIAVIRENLTGENLAITSVGPEVFPVYNPPYPTENLSWIEFDFNDIKVTIGKIYYMIIYTAKVTDNLYYCGGKGGNMYLNGSAYVSVDDGKTWENLSDGDGCFKTFGKDDPDLDQYQTNIEDGIPVGNFKTPSTPRYNWSIAQSFVPTKEVLTRVSLCISRNTTPPTIHPLVIAIRKNLTGKNLAIASINPEDAAEYPNYWWVEFDFDDLLVNIGETYYIVAHTENETDNAYVWGVNSSNLYPEGQMYLSFDNGNTWNTSYDFADMCFKTYGQDAAELEINIKGGRGVNIFIENIGGVNAVDIKSKVSITGGILGLINDTADLSISNLEPDNELTMTRQIFGLGWINITVTIKASNAYEIKKTTKGLIFGPFVFLPPILPILKTG